MATTNSRYDHPIYMDRVLIGGSVGASAGVRFAAYTSMLVKSVHIKPTTAGTTAAQVFALKKVLAANTTTTTVALTTYGSAAAAGTSVTPTTTLTLAIGDSCSVENAGTDATGVYAIGIECQVVPGADYTV
jgi:hypothetical protein